MHTAMQEEISSPVSDQTEETDSIDERATPQHVMLQAE
jgi:hypothetical protein